jgi:hypothetical protein
VASDIGADVELWADETLKKVKNSVNGTASSPKNISALPPEIREKFIFSEDEFFRNNSPQALLEDTGTRLPPAVRCSSAVLRCLKM